MALITEETSTTTSLARFSGTPAAITISPETGAKHWQALEYGGPEWQKVYFRLRNSVEGCNGYAKNPLAEGIEAAGSPRPRAAAQDAAGWPPARSQGPGARGDCRRRETAGENRGVTAKENSRDSLLRRGFALEYTTLAWNVIGIVVLAVAAVSARSVALAGFGLDSLIEIGASTVVIWELSGTGEARRRHALRLIGIGFAALAVYLLMQSTWALAIGHHPHHSPLGIVWTAVTAVVMFALAAGKARTGAALDNPVLKTEGRVTLIDGLLATAVLLGLVLNTAVGWWWADPAAGYVLVYYALREVREIFTGDH
ncbi:cation transporter (plasmid) [Streptomyces sp. NBC_01136]|uniref:cation transporter n=1 Tax=unclassified Streptomyces TaxID=2593676 RepID=UPI002F919B3B|nr:cation transporter [Streptomyces sp. NBC_01136]